MTGKLSKNFLGVGIGPLSKILAVKGYCDPGKKRTKKSRSEAALSQKIVTNQEDS